MALHPFKLRDMAAPVFRETFSYANKEVLNWFPGHMRKGLTEMQNRLRNVDGIIEVHDARIPFSGRNFLFKEKLAGVRPHMLILNKVDLADLTRKQDIVDRLKRDGVTDVMFTDCLRGDGRAVREILPRVIKMVKDSSRYDRSVVAPSAYSLMIIGVPNVGKSSLINALRRMYVKAGKATTVGALPGQTRAVQQPINISLQPKIQVLDTPGVSQPNIKSMTTGLKLALCHILHDYMVGEEVIVDFLLFLMNKRGDFRYVEYFQLDGPTDNVQEFLVTVAIRRNMYIRVRNFDGAGALIERPCFLSAAKHVLACFRSGRMGKFMLDEEKISQND